MITLEIVTGRPPLRLPTGSAMYSPGGGAADRPSRLNAAAVRPTSTRFRA